MNKPDVFMIQKFNTEHSWRISDRNLKKLLATTAFISYFTMSKLVNHMRIHTPRDIIEKI